MIEPLKNEFPDSVEGESSAGPIEIAKKLNEVIDALNIVLEALKNKEQ